MNASARSVVVYERVSSERQDISRQAVQRERAKHDCPNSKHVVLQDDGVSAFKTSIFDRPGGKRLCSMIGAGEVEAIYVDAQDRLSRGRQSEWWNFVDLCEQNSTRIVIDGRELRLNEEADEIRSALDAILARRESREKSHRVKGGLVGVVRNGRYLGSRRPYGWNFEGERQQRRLIVNTAEAATIARMVEWYEAGAGDGEIAGRLNERGIPSPAGGAWEKSEVRNILRSPLVAGFVHRLGETFPGLHEAIIEPDRWQRLQEIRATRRGTGRRPDGGQVFTGGILRCPECRAALRPRTTPKGYAYYECTGRWRKDQPSTCTQSNINARYLEEAILGGLLRWIYDPDETHSRIAEAAARERERAEQMIRDADRQIAAIERKRQRVQGDYLDGKLPAQLWAEASATLDTEREMAAAHAAELREAATDIQSQADDLDAQHEVLDRLQALQQVIIGQPGDPAHVEIVRQALRQTFEHIYLAPGPHEELVVIPVPRHEAVTGEGDPIEIELRGNEVIRTRSQIVAKHPLPAALTTGRAPT